MQQRIWWFTGLSGSGKTTAAKAVKTHMDFMGHKCIILDGDEVRKGLCNDLSFTAPDRVENLRRVGHVARLFWDEGYSIICSFVSPTEEGRILAAEVITSNLDPRPKVRMVYFSTPLEECERRDPKGLYKMARAGHLPNFTGVGQPYEIPVVPDYTFDTTGMDGSDLNETVVPKLVYDN